ncbi:unnamed protein product [Tilletia caries]|nr:unnamed protein product [Tilletia caries]
MPHNPCATGYSDFLSNVSKLKIIETGEVNQFANAFFDTETNIKIARALDEFGAYFRLSGGNISDFCRAFTEDE